MKKNTKQLGLFDVQEQMIQVLVEKSEDNMKKALDLIDEMKPCVVVIDELEKEMFPETEVGIDEVLTERGYEVTKILPCPKNCLKELNPDKHPGVFFGNPFVYDENWFGCWMCQREIRRIGARNS